MDRSKKIDISFAISNAMKWLTERNLSVAKLRKKLTQLYANDMDQREVIEQTITRLRELNLLREDYLAEQIARRHALKGDILIRQKLQLAEIDSSNIEKAIAELDSEYERAQEVAEKKWLNMKNDCLETKKNKLVRFLTARGFPLSISVKIAKNIIL